MNLKDVIEHNRKFPVPGFVSKQFGAGGNEKVQESACTPLDCVRASVPRRKGGNSHARPSISTDEARLNKTEKAFLEYLRHTAQVKCLHIMAITLKLAFDCRLTPDFSYYSEGGQLTFIDVKGWQREDALIKMKVAARTFPEWRFVIVKRIKREWKFEEIKP